MLCMLLQAAWGLQAAAACSACTPCAEIAIKLADARCLKMELLMLPGAGKSPAAGWEGSGLLQADGKPGNGGRSNETPH